MRIVIALGGNAILQKGQRGTFQDQLRNLRRTAKALAEIAMENEVVITHGNGPQVGALLIQQESAMDKVPGMPLDACDAMTQGLLGYAIQTELDAVLNELGARKQTATVLTRIVVNQNDPAFKNPTKPVGPFYPTKEGLPKHWVVKEDAGRGFRRVVPSPMPIRSLEAGAIKTLLEDGFIAICAGGGGIPVLPDGTGIEAVIDKDLASAVIGKEVGADALLILTSVDAAYLNFGSPDQKPLGFVKLDDLRRYYKEGHFAEGSMGPKILACIKFLESGGNTAIITSLEKAKEALEGKAGTIIRK